MHAFEKKVCVGILMAIGMKIQQFEFINIISNSFAWDFEILP